MHLWEGGGQKAAPYVGCRLASNAQEPPGKTPPARSIPPPPLQTASPPAPAPPGFDTRAYRFARPGVRFFEVDLPGPSEAKRGLVDATLPDAAAHPRPAYIAADLSKAWGVVGRGLGGGDRDPWQAAGPVRFAFATGWLGGAGRPAPGPVGCSRRGQ
jgi:hypothetical protein